MKKISLLLFAILSGLNSTGQNYEITVFGTSKIDKTLILDKFGSELKKLSAHYENKSDDYNREVKQFSETLKKLNPEFCYVNTQFFKSYSGKLDLIIDFVEKRDSTRRLNFRSIKALDIDTPFSLIELWNDYETLSYELFRNGEINDMSCPVIHCIWSFNHPRLKPFLSKLNSGVASNKESLIKTLHHDTSSINRSSAAFLLAHSDIDLQTLINTLMPAIHDPQSVVRNNSMRVVYYIARANPELKFDIPSIVNALDHPSFTDRNKALVILRSIPLKSLDAKTQKRLATILLNILIKKDAHNYRNAHTVVKNLSGLDHSADDILNWEKWVVSMPNE